LTSRWLEEISQAINTLCPNQPVIKPVNDPKSLEIVWNQYMASVEQCIKIPEVVHILDGTRDYNDFRE